MKLSRKFAISTLFSLCTVAAVSAQAADMEWSTNIDPVCGVTISDAKGSIAFAGEDAQNADKTVFTISSNNWMAGSDFSGKKPAAYVSLDLESLSDNLQGIMTSNNTNLTVAGKKEIPQPIERPIARWDGEKSRSILPADTYSAWMNTSIEKASLAAGEASVVTTISVTCPLSS
ncbi:hypothetical protein ACWJJH_04760 [Endozoicomonadaceae bacterium StTr2]